MHPRLGHVQAQMSLTKQRSDVTNYDVLKATFDEIVKDFGRIDGL